MNRDDYPELLAHLRRRMSEAGLEAVDDQIAADIRDDFGSPEELVLRYLGLFQTHLHLRSRDAAERVAGQLRELVGTEDGSPISGVEVVLTEGDRALYGRDVEVVDLRDTALEDIDPLLKQLDELRSDLRADLEER
jgi:hypothetical protein